MKKFFCGFLLGAMIFGAIGAFAVSYVANPVDFKVLVNGEEFISDPPALEVEGRTYLPLRAMGEALGVPVNWNEELRQAEVGETPVNQSVSKYKTYKESNDVIDFGAFLNREPVDIVIDGGSVGYIYDFAGITADDIIAYEDLMEEKGYTRKTVGTDNYLFYCFEDDKDSFGLSFINDYSKLKSYVAITILLK